MNKITENPLYICINMGKIGSIQKLTHIKCIF